MATTFINTLPWSYVLKYFWTTESVSRHFQNLFLERFGGHLTESVIEIGGEKHYGHAKYFPKATRFIVSNIGRDHDVYLDATQMPFDDNSQDAYVCVSVLEHVRDAQKAVAEIKRTLKVGGKLLLSVPFVYPRHDEVDYWRFGKSAYEEMFSDFEIVELCQWGGVFSVGAMSFHRRHAGWGLRNLLYNAIGFFLLLAAKFLERPDGFPLAYGLYAIKKD